jgi:hypothetical protein
VTYGKSKERGDWCSTPVLRPKQEHGGRNGLRPLQPSEGLEPLNPSLGRGPQTLILPPAALAVNRAGRGLGFYALRHVFRTAADPARDISAARHHCHYGPGG